MLQEFIVIGPHTLTVEDDDLVVLRLAGDLELEDASAIFSRIAETLAQRGRAFLIIDQTRPGIVPPEVQRLWIAWSLKHRLAGVALFAESLLQHTVSAMTLATIRRHHRNMFPAVLTKNETQARAWVAEQRARLALHSHP